MKKDKYDFDFLDEDMNVASTTECTGLIQIPPMSEDEAESYCEIYTIPEQVNNYEAVERPKGREIKSAPIIKK